jgi:predicted aspartyl protease
VNRGGDSAAGSVQVDVELTNFEDLVRVKAKLLPLDKVRRMCVRGSVDSRANYLMLPRRVARQLGVPADGEAIVLRPGRRKLKRQMVENVRVDLLGRHGVFRGIVEPRRTEVVLGAIVLGALDLLVDARTQTLQPRDPDTITAEM